MLNILQGEIYANGVKQNINLEPRSAMARQKGDLIKFDFEHAYKQQGPLLLRMFE